MSIVLVIPTYNKPALLKKCLAAIRRNTRGDYRVIIADDNSPDQDMQTYLGQLRAKGKVTVIANGSGTRGFPHNCNWAVKQTDEPLICLVNQDVEVTSGWLTAFKAEMRDSTVGIVGCLLLYPDTKGYGRQGLVQHAGVARNALGQPVHVFRLAARDDPRVQVRRDWINAVTFALALIRRETWDEVGGLDERYVGGQFEDISFNWTAREKGWKVVYTPKAVAYHYEHGSGEEYCRETSAANMERFIQYWGRMPSDEYLFTDEAELAGEEALVDAVARHLWDVYLDGLGVIGANPTRDVIEAGRQLMKKKWEQIDPQRQEKMRAYARKLVLAKVE